MALSLELSSLSKIFSGTSQKDKVHVFDDIACHIEKGHFLSIIGPSGCGKSTLLRIIAGLEQATKGQILIDGSVIEGRDRRVGLIFQEYALFPWRTTIQNIEMGLEILGVSKKIRKSAAMGYIRAFGLSGFENKYPKELSGGMKQRVAIARTLITNPAVVLMDEPFGALDSQTRNELQEFLLSVWAQRKETILFVTHNVEEAVYLSDRIMILSKRPAKVMKMIEVDSPRPRDRTSRASNLIRKRIINLLAFTEMQE